jgi:hypothetical protein
LREAERLYSLRLECLRRLGPEAESWGFQSGIGCGDPRSQKRDLGHPSIFTDRESVG